MRSARIGLLASAIALGFSTHTRRVDAQADINPPLPNVMLLVDSSGSMEYLSSSTEFPSCDPAGTSGRSRWIELQEVLTGTVDDYHCQSIDRNSASFKAEFSLGGVNPYDYNYKVPFHRAISNDCVWGPGTISPSSPYAFPSNALSAHKYTAMGAPCTSAFSQQRDGLLDIFATQVRFGLMTFDTIPDAGTGLDGTSANYSTGIEGQWSYFFPSARQGKPGGCLTLSDYEVGARNAAAPPWEGRMIAFGSPSANETTLKERNAAIQQVLLATRPYGATPIAGMLDDAETFFFDDNKPDPLNASEDFGPYKDPYVTGQCRDQFVILLSDGEPNMDLRPDCAATADGITGSCPYAKPEDLAENLAEKGVKVYVIGFAVSEVSLGGASTIKCAEMSKSDLNDGTGLCATNPGNSQLQACCVLNRIGYSGGTQNARFAANKEQLRTALGEIIGDTLQPTTRTLPVAAAAGAAQSSLAQSFRFLSSFVPRAGWSGVLERRRYVCDTENGLTPKLEDKDLSKGDDFERNLASGLGPARRFYSVEPELAGTQRHARRSIRPYVAADLDGVGTYTGQQYGGTAESFVEATEPAAMEIDGTTCQGLTAAACRDRYLGYNVGLTAGTNDPTRCRTAGAADCKLLGAIYHSTPRVIGAPAELLRDETYELFAAQFLKRPVVLYTSTNDGLFHAFKVASNDPGADEHQVDKRENNELWSFIPPAVLPDVKDVYDGGYRNLLDGVPVAKDVPAVLVNGQYRFERSLANARNAGSTWRTILVQAFGAGQGGYFALDVTNPEVGSGSGTGPKFLWQLTTDVDGKDLFGETGATPLITTVFMKDGDTQKEVAVAVLPGGGEKRLADAECDRSDYNDAPVWDANYQPRPRVSCYQGYLGRSLTIVRLDDGRVLRTFRRDANEIASAKLRDLVTEANIDSPITGEPVAFPGAAGAVADKVFVGDSDGTLWRLDLSNVDPLKWEMKLFFDAYWDDGATEGQPIATPPVLSTDDLGNVTVAFSTGDQEVLTGDPQIVNYVYSVTENVTDTATRARLNWLTRFTNGERVTGPLTLFNRALFYTSFAPEVQGSANVCSSGSSTVWGVDYVTPKNTSNVAEGGRAALPEQSGSLNKVQFIKSTSGYFGADAVIFGVAVAQVPTCVEEEEVDDTFLGSGKHSSFTTIKPGKFQLVMQVGGASDSGSGGGSATRTVELDLPSPTASPRIDSWASIIE